MFFRKLKLISDGAEYIASHYTAVPLLLCRATFSDRFSRWLITFFTIFQYILCTWGLFMLKRVAGLLFHFESSAASTTESSQEWFIPRERKIDFHHEMKIRIDM